MIINSVKRVSKCATGVSSQQMSSCRVASQHMATPTASRVSTIIYHQKNCISTMYLSILTNKNHEMDIKFSKLTMQSPMHTASIESNLKINTCDKKRINSESCW
jgi:hypothetical protein